MPIWITSQSAATLPDSEAPTAATAAGWRSNGTTTIANTIVAGNFDAPSNSGGETTAPDVSGEFTSGGYNLIGDGTGGSGFTNGTNGDQVGTAASRLDPLLGALRTNGGPTPHPRAAARQFGDRRGRPSLRAAARR